MIDPGGGGEVYDADVFLKPQTSFSLQTAMLSSTYRAKRIMEAWTNRTIVYIGPMNGRYDPELAAVLGEEMV